MTRPQVAVVGGGVLGLGLTERLQALGADVTLFRLHDRHGPSADSQRNHAWKQSGLLYGETNAPHVLAMHTSGEMLLRHVGLAARPDRGLFALPATGKAYSDFVDAARRLGLSGEVTSIDASRAEVILREYFNPDRYYFSVPDGPFDESDVFERLRRMAVRSGAQFFTLDSAVSLELGSGVARLSIEGHSYAYDAIVLAAGAGLPGLLESAGLEHDLAVFQSALCVLPDPLLSGKPKFCAPLFVDRETDLSIVRHSDCIVIGARFRQVVNNPSGQRVVSRQEQLELVNKLPPTIQDLARRRGRWTAGYKTEHLDTHGLPTAAPWIATPDDLGVRGLYAAIPGKATLTWYTMHLILHDVMATLIPSHLDTPVQESGSHTWVEPIRMHFSQHFKNFNEGELS